MRKKCATQDTSSSRTSESGNPLFDGDTMKQACCVALTFMACANPVGSSPPEEMPAMHASREELRPTGKLAYQAGPYATRSAEYRLPASIDPDILPDRMTEVWAVIHTPDPLPPGRIPLLVFLHGNHATCGHRANPRIDDNRSYTSKGTCPEGYVVVPSHRGYDYLATRLASWGYAVVSINANRGITAGIGPDDDIFLNLARGRLVLKHLQVLSQWNATAGQTPTEVGLDLFNTLDFSQVGLMGHSRGGEGVRAALALYQDADSVWPAKIGALDVRAMLEIAPVDQQTDRELTPHGIAWGVIAPTCDGDVFDLSGLDVYERLVGGDRVAKDDRPKMAVAIWGANHNFFNTEWQQSDEDPSRCPIANPIFLDPNSKTGSSRQQQAGLMAAVSFFRAFVAAEDSHNSAVWNSDFALDKEVNDLTRFERAFEYRGVDPQTVLINPLTALDGLVAKNVTLQTASLRTAALIVTPSQGAGHMDVPVSLETRAAATALGSAALSFRGGRPGLTGAPKAPIEVQLIDDAGILVGRVPLSDYLEHGPNESGYVLANARIHLSEFGDIAPSRIGSVRFAWTSPSEAPLALSTLRFVEASAMPAPERARNDSVVGMGPAQSAPEVHAAFLDGHNVKSPVSFGFRSGRHALYADGQRVTHARIEIEEDGHGARIVGAMPSGTLEIRYESRETWTLY
jgi:hypothetical protein